MSLEKPGSREFVEKTPGEYLLKRPFEGIERFPQLFAIASEANEKLNERRRKLDLAPLALHGDDVRFLSPLEYDTNPFQNTYGHRGFAEHATRKVYLRKDFIDERDVDMMDVSSVVIHELAHRARERNGLTGLAGGLQLSRLEEGFAEWENKDLLSKYFLRKILTTKRIADRQRYIRDVMPTLEGLPLRADDLIPSSSGDTMHIVSYLPEVRLVELLHNQEPELFRLLLARAFRGDVEGAYADICEVFGRDVADEMANPKVSTLDILQKLQA